MGETLRAAAARFPLTFLLQNISHGGLIAIAWAIRRTKRIP